MKTETKASEKWRIVIHDKWPWYINIMEGETIIAEIPWAIIDTRIKTLSDTLAVEENAKVKAAAERIVRAVNAHDALVEALEKVRDRIEPCEYVELLEEVKAALALAKEGK